MDLKSFPLCWPDGWKRHPNRERARFGTKERVQSTYDPKKIWMRSKNLTVAASLGRISDSLARMGISEDSVIVSTNVPVRLDGLPRSGTSEPSDPGAAAYWKQKGKQQCMAIDRYDRVADNLAAIAATLEALRAIERHGGGEILERAFRGFAALPAAIITARPWRDVLNFKPESNPSMDAVEDKFRELAKKKHSDTGGSDEAMRELIQARIDARMELNA